MKQLFLNYFWDIPAHISITKHRDYRITAVIGLCGFVAHVFFLSLFVFFKVPQLVIFNVFSIATFTYIVLQNKKHTKKYYIIICNIEVVAHAVVATYYLGYQSSFHFYVFLMFMGIFILSTYKNINWFLGIVSILSYFFIIWMVTHYAPVITTLSNNGIEFFSYFNLLCAALICIMLSFYFRTTANDAEDSLIDLNKQQELQNKELEIQKLKTENALNQLNQNVDYAQRIQQSILPQLFLFDTTFGKNNSGIIFKPKNTVSGDFYFLEHHNNKIYLAVADCTGHGVSGAMMSIIGINSLSKIINNGAVTSSAQILSELHVLVKKSLHYDNTNTTDGMEISLCVIDTTTKTIDFSGGGASLCCIQNNELRVIKGDKFAIGGRNFINETNRLFNTHLVNYTNNMRLFMFSDGYQDQFGGINYQRYTSKRLLNDIDLTKHLELQQQLIILDNNFTNWKQNAAQIDDVLLLGVTL